MKKTIFCAVLLFLIGSIPASALAACEALPSTKDVSYYKSLYTTVENGYQTVDKLYNHGVMELSVLQQYYSARDQWKSAYNTYIDNYDLFIKEVNESLQLSGQAFIDHCSSVDSAGKAFVQSQTQLLQPTKTILSVFGHFSDRTPTTNDPMSSQQYYLKFAKIDSAKPAVSASPIIVAVIDDGIYINHNDLRSNIWINSREVIGNGKDDDGNGYVDDIYGYDFIGNTAEMTVRGSHGTHVAGIIGAVSNNGLGIQGEVQNIKLMPLIACGDKGCPTEAIMKAIRYAVDNGASIINMSLGSNGTTEYTTEYNDVVRYAFEHGVLIVAAAGNGDVEGGSGQNLDVIPQSPVCNDNDQNMVLGVGAVTNDAYRTGWSNYGKCVDIYAPGEEVLSTSVPNLDNGLLYSAEDGTSFSAPIVSGIAALIKQKYPSINPREITELVKKTNWNGIADAMSALNTTYDKYPVSQTSVPQTPVSTNSTPNNFSTNDSGDIDQTNNTFISEQLSKLTTVNTTLVNRMKGSILLQVQTYGAAWYLHPITLKRYYLKDGATAYQMLRAFGLGVSETDYEKIAAGNYTLKTRLKGRIILRAQAHGEAYYINPKDLSVTYLKDGDAAYQAMRNLSLGITDTDIAKIPIERFVPVR